MALNVIAEALPRYPVALAAGTGINITSAGGTRTISLDASHGPFLDRADIKALLNPQPGQTAYLNERGREGTFVYRSGNYAALVASDTREAIYLASDDEPTTSGAWVRDEDGSELKLTWFGAIGDGVADDTAAAQAWAAMIRSRVSTDNRAYVKFVADCGGGLWRITSTINLTNIIAWNLEIRGGVWLLETTGKPGWDLVGSRGYTVNGTMWWGSKTSRPTCAWQAARSTQTGACDKVQFYECTTTGHFSVSPYIAYGQEETLHVHCQYFNGDRDGYVGLHEGIDTITVTSEFATAVTGPTSHINNTFLHCIWQWLPDEVTTISNITKASSAQVTVASSVGFVVGDDIIMVGVGGMTEAMLSRATITAIAGNTITINMNTSGFSSYTSGGLFVLAQNKPSLRISRTSQFVMIGCYIVNCGSSHIEIVFDDATYPVMNEIHIDALFEGGTNPQNIAVVTGGSTCNLRGFSLKTYNSAAIGAIMYVPPETGGSVNIYSQHISSTQQRSAIVILGADNSCPGTIRGGTVIQDTFVSGDRITNCWYTETSTNKSKYIDAKSGTHSVSVVSASGTITSVTGSCTITAVSQQIQGTLSITMTSIGTGTGALIATLPFTALADTVFFGRNSATSAALIGFMSSGSALVNIQLVGGGAPLADGQSLAMTLAYSAATA